MAKEEGSDSGRRWKETIVGVQLSSVETREMGVMGAVRTLAGGRGLGIAVS